MFGRKIKYVGDPAVIPGGYAVRVVFHGNKVSNYRFMDADERLFAQFANPYDAAVKFAQDMRAQKDAQKTK